MKYPELSKQEVNSFVEENVQKLISNIILKEDDIIFVNRETMKEGRGIFVHPIYICPVEEIYRTEYYDNSEIFTKKNLNLFLYLKGRLLIQRTTIWEIYSGNPFSKQYKITCNYSIKEN